MSALVTPEDAVAAVRRTVTIRWIPGDFPATLTANLDGAVTRLLQILEGQD